MRPVSDNASQGVRPAFDQHRCRESGFWVRHTEGGTAGTRFRTGRLTNSAAQGTARVGPRAASSLRAERPTTPTAGIGPRSSSNLTSASFCTCAGLALGYVLGSGTARRELWLSGEVHRDCGLASPQQLPPGATGHPPPPPPAPPQSVRSC